MRDCKATIYLYSWELVSMNEYSSSMPSGQTTWKIWRRNLNAYTTGVRCRKCKTTGRADNSIKLSQVSCPTCKEKTLTKYKLSPHWIVGQYIPHYDPKIVGIRWHTVVLKHGPEPHNYKSPDWSNFQRWKKEHKKCG